MVKLYKDKKWLYNQYWNLNKSEYQIAKEQNVDPATICYWLKKLGIQSRSISDANCLAQGNHVKLTSEAIEFIEGELLGDGSIQPQNKYSAIYAHTSKHIEYLEWLSETFDGFGIKQCGKINKGTLDTRLQFKNSISYLYASLSYPELLPIRNKWYRLYNPATDPLNWRHKYIKIVPRNIKLTPLVCRQWYIGDGSLHHKKYKKYQYNSILLCSEGFPIFDIEFLVKKLNELGFKSTKQKDNNIYISMKSTPAFLKYIGECPINCYQYKWALKR